LIQNIIYEVEKWTETNGSRNKYTQSSKRENTLPPAYSHRQGRKRRRKIDKEANCKFTIMARMINFSWHDLSKLAQPVTLLPCMWEMLVSNPDRDIYYP
jgi:hypothetical protein